MASISGLSKTLLGMVVVGAGGPAIALFMGYPKPVVDGLGGRPVSNWTDSTPEAKFGLYLYTISDICLAMVCGAALLGDSPSSPVFVSEPLALGAIAMHQFCYLAAAIPTLGCFKEQLGSVIFGAISGVVAIVLSRKE